MILSSLFLTFLRFTLLVLFPGETQGKKTDKPKESAQRLDVDLTRLPLKEQRPGVITWAKISGHNWWPGDVSSLATSFTGSMKN